MQVILWPPGSAQNGPDVPEIRDLGNPLIQVGFDPLLGLSVGKARDCQGFSKNRFDALSIGRFHFQTNPPLI